MDDTKHLQRNSWPDDRKRVFIPKQNSGVLLWLLLPDKPTLQFLCNSPIHKELVGPVAEEWTGELPQWALSLPTEPQREDHVVPAGTDKGTRENSERPAPRAAEPQPRGEAGGLGEEVRNCAYSKKKNKAGCLASAPLKRGPLMVELRCNHLSHMCSAKAATQQQRKDS